MRDRISVRWAVGLFAAALAVRLCAVAVFGISGPAVEDEEDYVFYAQALAGGTFEDIRYAHLANGGWAGAFRSFRPPVLPALLAPLAALGGGVVAMRATSLALGALAAPLGYLAIRRTSLGERGRWVGAALAVWPPSVYLSLRILTEPLALALLLGALAVRPDGDDRLIPCRRSALAGLLAGLSVLARSSGLIPALLLLFARDGLRRRAMFLAGFALVVVPWVARNWMLHGRPLLTTNTGLTLVGGNCDAALRAEWPGKWLEPDVVYADAADPPDTLSHIWLRLSESENDARFTRDALDWITSHPADFAVLAFHKVVRLFDPDQHSAKADAGLKRLLGWITFAPVLVLAAWGLFLVRGDPTFRPWLLVLAGTVVTAVIFYGDVRMRSPAEPTLLALATVAAFRLVDRRRAAPGTA